VHRHNATLPGSGQSAVGGTGAGLSDHRATCVTAESWCGRAAGIDGPTLVMATYKVADCTRYIPYPNNDGHVRSCSPLLQLCTAVCSIQLRWGQADSQANPPAQQKPTLGTPGGALKPLTPLVRAVTPSLTSTGMAARVMPGTSLCTQKGWRNVMPA
jgi:hypothetical protein